MAESGNFEQLEHKAHASPERQDPGWRWEEQEEGSEQKSTFRKYRIITPCNRLVSVMNSKSK
jgi:hypothetical protein